MSIAAKGPVQHSSGVLCVLKAYTETSVEAMQRFYGIHWVLLAFKQQTENCPKFGMSIPEAYFIFKGKVWCGLRRNAFVCSEFVS